jgi:hypothetical protein
VEGKPSTQDKELKKMSSLESITMGTSPPKGDASCMKEARSALKRGFTFVFTINKTVSELQVF